MCGSKNCSKNTLRNLCFFEVSSGSFVIWIFSNSRACISEIFFYIEIEGRLRTSLKHQLWTPLYRTSQSFTMHRYLRSGNVISQEEFYLNTTVQIMLSFSNIRKIPLLEKSWRICKPYYICLRKNLTNVLPERTKYRFSRRKA